YHTFHERRGRIFEGGKKSIRHQSFVSVPHKQRITNQHIIIHLQLLSIIDSKLGKNYTTSSLLDGERDIRTIFGAVIKNKTTRGATLGFTIINLQVAKQTNPRVCSK